MNLVHPQLVRKDSLPIVSCSNYDLQHQNSPYGVELLEPEVYGRCKQNIQDLLLFMGVNKQDASRYSEIFIFKQRRLEAMFKLKNNPNGREREMRVKINDPVRSIIEFGGIEKYIRDYLIEDLLPGPYYHPFHGAIFNSGWRWHQGGSEEFYRFIDSVVFNGFSEDMLDQYPYVKALFADLKDRFAFMNTRIIPGENAQSYYNRLRADEG